MWPKRRAIAARLRQHEREGKTALLITLTPAAGIHRDLHAIFPAFLDALATLGSSRAWKRAKAACQARATVRAIEITHDPGRGWYPHAHFVWMTDAPTGSLNTADIEQQLRSAWQAALASQGLPTTSAACVHVTAIAAGTSDQAARYITKTLSPLWENRGDSRTPWELLRDAAETGDAPAAHLWQQYAYSTRGVSMLRMSGFRDEHDGDTGHDDQGDEHDDDQGEKVENCSATAGQPGPAGQPAMRVLYRVRNGTPAPAMVAIGYPYAPAAIKPAPVAAGHDPPAARPP